MLEAAVTTTKTYVAGPSTSRNRRKLQLRGRLTWRDAGGVLRFASVVTRDVSDLMPSWSARHRRQSPSIVWSTFNSSEPDTIAPRCRQRYDRGRFCRPSIASDRVGRQRACPRDMRSGCSSSPGTFPRRASARWQWPWRTSTLPSSPRSLGLQTDAYTGVRPHVPNGLLCCVGGGWSPRGGRSDAQRPGPSPCRHHPRGHSVRTAAPAATRPRRVGRPLRRPGGRRVRGHRTPHC